MEDFRSPIERALAVGNSLMSMANQDASTTLKPGWLSMCSDSLRAGRQVRLLPEAKSRLVLGPTKPLLNWISEGLCQG